jgi:hypothetical protein
MHEGGTLIADNEHLTVVLMMGQACLKIHRRRIVYSEYFSYRRCTKKAGFNRLMVGCRA